MRIRHAKKSRGEEKGRGGVMRGGERGWRKNCSASLPLFPLPLTTSPSFQNHIRPISPTHIPLFKKKEFRH